MIIPRIRISVSSECSTACNDRALTAACNDKALTAACNDKALTAACSVLECVHFSLIRHGNERQDEGSPDLKLDLLAVNLNRSNLEVDTCTVKKPDPLESATYIPIQRLILNLVNKQLKKCNCHSHICRDSLSWLVEFIAKFLQFQLEFPAEVFSVAIICTCY